MQSQSQCFGKLAQLEALHCFDHQTGALFCVVVVCLGLQLPYCCCLVEVVGRVVIRVMVEAVGPENQPEAAQ